MQVSMNYLRWAKFIDNIVWKILLTIVNNLHLCFPVKFLRDNVIHRTNWQCLNSLFSLVVFLYGLLWRNFGTMCMVVLFAGEQVWRCTILAWKSYLPLTFWEYHARIAVHQLSLARLLRPFSWCLWNYWCIQQPQLSFWLVVVSGWVNDWLAQWILSQLDVCSTEASSVWEWIPHNL